MRLTTLKIDKYFLGFLLGRNLFFLRYLFFLTIRFNWDNFELLNQPGWFSYQKSKDCMNVWRYTLALEETEHIIDIRINNGIPGWSHRFFVRYIHCLLLLKRIMSNNQLSRKKISGRARTLAISNSVMCFGKQVNYKPFVLTWFQKKDKNKVQRYICRKSLHKILKNTY